MVRLHRRHLIVVLLLAASLACSGSNPSAPSGAKSCTVTTTSVLLNAGDTLRMKFSVPQSTADILTTSIEYLPNSLGSGFSLSCQLFDGDRLLGTGPCVGGWQSAAAVAKLTGVPTIDFAPIAAGTSAGRVDFIVAGGSWAFDGRGTVSVGRITTTASGTNVTFVAAGTAAPLELLSDSCR